MTAAVRPNRLRVCIHAGMHKTGTTALQRLLAENRDALLPEGIYYPRKGASHPRILGVKQPAWNPAAAADAIREAKAAGAETLLLSSEAVSTLSAAQFRVLTECFAGHDLTYLFCLRHWRSFLPSRWSQNCLRRDSQTLAAYTDMVTDAGHQHIDWRFDAMLDRAASSGDCNVTVVSYDNAMATDGGVILALLRAARLPESLIARFKSDARQNVRGDPTLLELCRLLNGIVANQRNLPQDDLCRALGEHRTCNEYFDLLPAIEKLAPAVRAQMLALIAAAGFKTWECPDVQNVSEALSQNHAGRVVNPIDGLIFVESPPQPISYSELNWRSFHSALDSAQFPFD